MRFYQNEGRQQRKSVVSKQQQQQNDRLILFSVFYENAKDSFWSVTVMS